MSPASYRHEVMHDLTRAKAFGIIREATPDRARAVTEALAETLAAFELTLTTPGALELIEELSRRGGDVVIGAGTVLDEASARLAILAGARFLVSPNLREEVVRCGHRYGVPVIPGVATATEMFEAAEAGADAIKLFPAGSHGLEWFRSLRTVAPGLALVPTGGIHPEEATSWLDAGAAAVGIGGNLTAGEPHEIKDRAARLRASLEG